MDAGSSIVEPADPVKDFASQLRRLQVDAGGPSVRDLERLTDKLGTPYTRGTIQDKLTGRSGAAWEFVEAFVRACALHAGTGEPNLSPWRTLHTRMVRDVAAARVGRRRPSRLEVCPYRGLETFTAEHAEWFHGRAVAVQRVLAGLAAHRRGLLLLGPSGAGKSSLAQAGVLPAIAAGQLPGSDRWSTELIRPGDGLLTVLDRAVLPVDLRAEARAGRRSVLIIDQFEELLTPSGSDGQEQARREILDQLVKVVEGSVLTVVLIMRDDFYSRLASQAPRLLELLVAGVLNLPATLGVEDLHDIIRKPAEAVGVGCQDGLADRIVTDILAIDPEAVPTRRAPTTVLPLLELTLQQLWHRRTNEGLTHDAYQRLGGVMGGVAAWCDEVLDQLSPARHLVARHLLTALVRPADEAHRIPAVRQQIPLAALRDLVDVTSLAGAGEHIVDEVLAVLTDHRVVTTRVRPGESGGVAVAELVHDALIRDWGALRTWVNHDHRFQDWLRRAGERRTSWAQRHDPGDLLRGTDLAEGVDWSAQRRLPETTAEFLAASRRHQRTAIRRARRVTLVLATLLVMSLTAMGLALWQRKTAVSAQQVALSRQLAAQSAALSEFDPDLAGLLGVQAYRTSPTTEASGSLYAAAASPLRRSLTGPTETVLSVAFSPDGRTLATASYDRTVRLWDLPGGHLRSILTGHTDVVRAVTFSRDGHTLATAGDDRTVRLWDLPGGRPRAILTGHTDVVRAVTFSPDGHTLATAGHDRTVRLWNLPGGRPRAILTGHTDAVRAVTFSPDGHTLATGSNDYTTRLWDVAGGRLRTTLTGHTGFVLSAAFSPDGHTLATGSTDHTARLWDLSSRHLRSILTGHTNYVYSVAFSPDGKTVATGSDDYTTRLWDVAGGQTRETFAGSVFAVAFSPDGHTLATGGADGTARLWDLASGQPRATLTGHTGYVWSVVLSPDGHTLATGGGDNAARLWEMPGGRLRTAMAGSTGYAMSVAFSPDGHTLATGGTDGTMRLWDLTGGHLLNEYPGRASSLVFSPDGRTLAIGGYDHTARLWDVPSGQLRTTLTGHTSDVLSVAFSPDGHTLATGSIDRTARLWDVASGQPRRTLIGHASYVYSVAFSPDGRTLATGSDDRTVRLWDVPSGQLRSTLTGHTRAVLSVAFSLDGHTLAAGGTDHTVRLWDVALPTPGAAIDKICRTVNRDLTAQERAMYLPRSQSSAAVCPAPAAVG